MMRPPLSNLFAVYDADPAALDEMMPELRRSGEFAEVWRPAPGWVAAAAPLPGSLPDDDLARRHRLAFAEGRDVLLERSGNDPVARLREIAELADLHPDRLSSLPGDFGFIRFRPNGGATIVRSCGGLVPFYFKQSGERCAIGTRLGDFVRYLPDEPRLDPLVNAIWASSWGILPDGRTFLDGVTILGRGHFARRGKTGRMQVGRYWNPRPKQIPYPTPALARGHAERLRTLLIEKLRRDLDPEDGNLLTLSGGVDSSSLAALAAGVVGCKAWTFSVLPRKEREDAVQHEMSFIEPLAQQYGFERRWAVHWHERLLLDLWRSAPRIVFHVLHPALCSLPRILKEAPVRVLFGGEFADAVCGSGFTVPDWARQTSPLRLLMDGRMALKDPRSIARWAKYRMASLRGREPLPFPRELLEETDPITNKPLDLFHPAVREEYLIWWERKRKELRGDTDPWRYLAMHSATIDPFVPMNWEACSALGIRRSFPFFNREVLELAFECHPAELYGPGTKKLLRSALHNDVPSRNLYRQDKGRSDKATIKLMESVEGTMPEPLPDEIERILSPESFSKPPKTLDYWRFRGVTRLLIFVESLRERRRGFNFNRFHTTEGK